MELLFLLFVIIWSKTGAGLFELVVVFIFFFFLYGKIKLPQKIAIFVLCIVLYNVIITYFSNNIIVAEILRRTKEFSLIVDASGPHSGFYRIWRGYFIYAAGNIFNQIFGTAIGSVAYVVSKVYIPGINYEGIYMNGIQSLLVTGGIVGTILFIYYIVRLYRGFSISGRCIIVAMMGLFFIENMLYSPKMFLFILIAYCISDIEKNNMLAN